MEKAIIAVFTAIAALFGMLTAYLKYRQLKKKYTVISVENNNKNLLTEHYVFKTLRQYRDIISSRFDLNDPIKTTAFKDFIINYIDISGKYLFEVAKVLDKSCTSNLCSADKISTEDCPMDFMELMRIIDDLYASITQAMDYYKDSAVGYSSEEKVILDYVKKLFMEHHRPGADFIKGSISCLPSAGKYTTCSKLLASNIFTAYQAVFSNLLLGTEIALKNVNGFFNGKNFNLRVYSLPEWYVVH